MSSSFWCSITRFVRQLSRTCTHKREMDERLRGTERHYEQNETHLYSAHVVRHALLPRGNDVVDELAEVSRDIIDVGRDTLARVPDGSACRWFCY